MHLPLPRLATPADLPELVRVERAAFAAVDQLSRASWRGLLRSPSAAVWVLPAEDAAPGAPLAGVAVWLTRRGGAGARLYSLATDPALRRRGGARALLAASVQALPPGVLRLSLEVRQDNHAAIALYTALGFVSAGPLLGYYGDGAPGLRLRAPRARVAAALVAGQNF